MPTKPEFDSRANDYLLKLQKKQRGQIVRAVAKLLANPYPVTSQWLDRPWRAQDVGEFRIVYQDAGDVLQVALIGKRNDREIYKQYERMQK